MADSYDKHGRFTPLEQEGQTIQSLTQPKEKASQTDPRMIGTTKGKRPP